MNGLSGDVYSTSVRRSKTKKYEFKNARISNAVFSQCDKLRKPPFPVDGHIYCQYALYGCTAAIYAYNNYNGCISLTHFVCMNICGLPCKKRPSCIFFEKCFSCSNSYICANVAMDQKQHSVCFVLRDIANAINTRLSSTLVI